MESDGSKITKPKRVRTVPYRKWSSEEQQKLITYMRDNRPIEKPTAQVYYKKILETQNLRLDWSLVRLKARHLRQCYTKARAWQNSTGALAMQDAESTESIILRTCPFFYDLEDIFGYKEFQSNEFVMDTEALENNSTSTTDDFDAGSTTTNANVATTPEESFQEVGLESTCNTINRKAIYSRTGLADVLTMHTGLIKVKQQKLEIQSKMKDREPSLKEKECDLQYEKFLFEKEKCNSEERIRTLEIEMKEKLALKELEMKGQIAMEELKIKK
ncbi:PREDICTED: uncharacterized protein LOC108971323 [Bactrocera latifrons]|uniref:uncharacterized protein LOC108971323 n=1 Tax=Bactrocera latifrons TaxID=174628 RepID=UPI0008DE4CD8|nr:PREDICTED: uncharacterized protein LOC108971323 [Bactrocera latifrons]